MHRENRLRVPVRFVLFVTSYFPLFMLIIINQISKAPNNLTFGGVGLGPITLFLKHYGVSFTLVILMLIGSLGLFSFIKAIERDIDSSGAGIIIRQLENRNSEAIGYIGTYIIPFLFNDYSDIYSIISLCVLLLVVYFIYIQSSLIMINPVLNIFYSLYQIDFFDSSKHKKRGMLIIKEKYLSEGDAVVVSSIGHKLYFGKNKGGEGA